MTRTTTRNTQTREMQTREEEFVYQEPNLLDLPQSVTDRFKDQGFDLRWVRITLKGADDYSNVGKKLAEGHEFVSLEEVPELAHSSMVREEGRYKGTVCRGDLALAKIETKRVLARQQYMRQQTSDRTEAINRQLEGASDRRMPITNASKSSVTKGRNPAFD